MKKAIVILVLLFFSWIIKSYQKEIPIFLGIDLVLLCTVLTVYSYGLFIGIVTGIASMFVSSLWRGKFNSLTIISYLLIVFVALFVPLFGDGNISFIGITITILYDAIFLFLSVGFFDGRISRGLTFVISHLAFNLILFLRVAPVLLKFM